MRKNASNQVHGRAQIADFLCPDNGIRGKQQRMGVKPKDHMKENIKAMRANQDRIREEKEMDEYKKQQGNEVYKLSQFRDVGAKVFDCFDEQENRDRGDIEFLSKGQSERRREDLMIQRRADRAELEAKMEEAKYYAGRPTTPRKNVVPKSDEVARLAPRSNTDFVRDNKYKAQLMAPTKKEEKAAPSKHSEYGRVPNYIQQRNAVWEEEKEEIRRRAPDPNCPKGMALMPEEERLNTLEVLEQNREEALRQLGKLPFVIEVPSALKKKNDLEIKLKEIESAMALFSKPKVYIRI